MMRKGLASTLATLLLAAGSLVTTSCGSSSTKIRFVHTLFTGVGGVDVIMDNKTIVTNLTYGTGGSYLSVSPGSHTIEIRPTGSTSSGSDILNVSQTITGGTQTTMVLYFSTTLGGPNLKGFADNTKKPAAGTAGLRVIHLCNFFPGVDVYAVPPQSGITGVSPQISNLQFENANDFSQHPLSAGNYEIFVTQTGTQRVLINTASFPALNSQQSMTMILYDTSPFFFTLTDLN